MLYSMKETCKRTGLTYQTLKFYCNQGLVPYVKRDENNHRVFDDDDVNWINSLTCLKKCNLSIQEMRDYLKMCMAGESTIPERKELLARKQIELKDHLKTLEESIAYIDWKQDYYDDILEGRRPYQSSVAFDRRRP